MAQGKDVTLLIPRVSITFEKATVAFTDPEAKRTDIIVDGVRTLGINGEIPQNVLELAKRLDQEADNLAKARKEVFALILDALKAGKPVQDGPRIAKIKTRATTSVPYKELVEELGAELGWSPEKLEAYVEPRRKRGTSESAEID